ncbi:RNA 2',3'-cyclic phosphodiesterase [Brevibacillus dissolubilis]|uniref:RNA 2',3'-cyclic phosphodiesterase n=1 Tax=Brevibacillus dissolubilis TaxID=1844116 RepID=UPI001117A9B3|nr:RNA 2',3'-cyclic phosphodiesterase [Brevibacillus dissolubilis]
MRLFVALDIPPQAVDYLEAVQKRVKQELQADRWQPLHNLHLTLHFLGEVDEQLIPLLKEDMDLVASIIEPFTLVVGKFGAFPKLERPRVMWLGIEGLVRSLQQLHLLLAKRFDLHPGLTYDRKEYRPHITMARGPHSDGKNVALPVADWNERLLDPNPPHWKVEGFHLYQSELLKSGARHTIIHTSTLGKEAHLEKIPQTIGKE